MAKRRRRPLRAKYIIRRFMLAAVIAGLLGAGGWFAYTRFLASGEKLAQAPAPSSALNDEELSEPQSPSDFGEENSASEPEPGVRTSFASAEDWELLLVNPSNYLPENYEVELETMVDGYSVDKRIADSVKLMFADAKQDGISLIICSAYRSVEKQQTLFSEKEQEFIAAGKNEQEAIAAAATIVAKPGSSEHHTGLAMDIVTPSYTELDSGFADTPAFKWLSENAYKYGFVLRYPSDKQNITKIIYEPWHYRYVGEENARIMKEKGLCLEEYVDFLRQDRSKALEAPPEEAPESTVAESEKEAA